MATPNHDMIEKLHVLLVDNDKEVVTRMVDLLKFYDYKVTLVGTASAAMSMISKGKQKIDVMIINVYSSNIFSHLLAQTVALNIVSIVVCDEYNEHMAKKSMDDGAYFYLKSPFDEEIIKYLWQFVLREKIQREKAREGLETNRDQMNVAENGNNNIVRENERQPGVKKNVCKIQEQRNNIHDTENDVVSNEQSKSRRKRGRKSMKDINGGENQRSATSKVVSKKDYTEWTNDLHAKFMEAVHQLGEGRCFPNEILKAMNVSGLTLRQVASHLQKCRRNNWRAPGEQKSTHHRSGKGSPSGSKERSSFQKYGTMPFLPINVPNLQHNQDQTQKGLEFPFSTLNTNNISTQGESSIQQQLYHPQLHVQPRYYSNVNPLNNPLLSTQNNVDGRLLQQHEQLFGMLSSQELQGPNNENINYMSGLEVNSGDHHTQSDYTLNLNVTHGATYSGGAAINELGAAHANFQQYVGEPNKVAATSNVQFSGTEKKSDESLI